MTEPQDRDEEIAALEAAYAEKLADPMYRPFRGAGISTENPVDVVYPQTSIGKPPPGMRRRARRNWRRDAHAERRARTREQVRSWRDVEVDGLPIVLLAVGLTLAVWWFWPTGSDQPTDVVDDVVVADRSAAGLPQPGAAPAAPGPARADETAPRVGTDAGAPPPPPPGLFEGPAGEAAYEFALDYATYTPVAPNPVDTWVDSWADDATDTLADQGRQEAPRLWDFTVRDGVHAINPLVLDGTRTGDSWRLQMERQLFPIGGDQSTPTTTQQITLALTVIDGQVAAAALTD